MSLNFQYEEILKYYQNDEEIILRENNYIELVTDDKKHIEGYILHINDIYNKNCMIICNNKIGSNCRSISYNEIKYIINVRSDYHAEI